MRRIPKVAAHPVYPKVVPNEFNLGYHSVYTPTHHYQSVPERDVPVLLQHLHNTENYDGLPTDFRVAYVEVGDDLEGIGYAPRAGKPTEYEQWGGEPTEDAIRAHVGTKIDWDGGQAEVVGIEDLDQEGSVEWVMFQVKPLAQVRSR